MKAKSLVVNTVSLLIGLSCFSQFAMARVLLVVNNGSGKAPSLSVIASTKLAPPLIVLIDEKAAHTVYLHTDELEIRMINQSAFLDRIQGTWAQRNLDRPKQLHQGLIDTVIYCDLGDVNTCENIDIRLIEPVSVSQPEEAFKRYKEVQENLRKKFGHSFL